MSSKPTHKPILYARSEIGGIMVRPDSRDVMRKAVEGHPVAITSGNDYINLYHVFERLQASDVKLANLTLVRRQIGSSRWLLFVVRTGEEPPALELQDDYDPKRGRYKRYAEQLAAGDVLRFSDRREAVKARRAWQLYVRRENRKNLRSSIRRIGKSDAFVVAINPRV